MSGGSLNYICYTLADHVGDFGDKELDELVKDLADLFHDREWYLSADIGIGNWRESRDKFKDKWFTPHGREERIERYLKEVSDEVRESFGMSNKRCWNCTRWTLRDDSPYGKCEYHTTCLMHRSEDCEKFEEGEKHG